MENKPVKSVKEILSNIKKNISYNSVNSPFDTKDIKQINTINSKVEYGETLTSEEIDTLEKISSKIKEVSDTYNNYDIDKDTLLSDIINKYKIAINNHNLSLERRQKILSDLNRLLKENGIKNTTIISPLDMNVNNVIEHAKDISIKNGIKVDSSKLDPKIINPQQDGSITTGQSSSEPTFRQKISNKLQDEKSGLHQSIKTGLDVGLSAVGLGGINSAFNSSSSMMNYFNSWLKPKDIEPVTEDISEDLQKDKKSNLLNRLPKKDKKPVENSFQEIPNDNSNKQSNLLQPSDNVKNSLSQISGGVNYSNKLLENIYSEVRKGKNQEVLRKDNKNKKDESSGDNFLDDLVDDLGGGSGKKRGNRRGAKARNRSTKGIATKTSRLGKIGRGLSTVGRGAGRLAGSALSIAGLGGALDLASGAVNLGSSAVGSIGSTIGSGLGVVGSKLGLGGIAKAGSKLGKFIPGLGLGLTAASAGLSAYQGYDDKQAQSLFGSKSTSAKIGSSIASVGEDLSFGLISKESIAGVEKSIGSGVTSAFNWLIGKKDKNEKKSNIKLEDNKTDPSKNAEDNPFGMRPDEIKALFSDFGSSISSFIQGIPNILKNIGSIAGKAVNALPGVGAVKGLYNAAEQSGLVETVTDEASNWYNNITGKSGKFGGANDGTLGNTGSGKTLGKVTEERTQILYDEAKKSGMSKEQIALMMGQVDHETGGFKFMREMASGKDYEGRKDLGNTQTGDGVKYKGRGYNQLTGRANYEHFGKLIGVDLVNHPELAEDPTISAKLTVAYQKERVSKAKSVEEATKAINGGYNHLDRRKAATAKWVTKLNDDNNTLEKTYQDGSMDKALKEQNENKKSPDNASSKQTDAISVKPVEPQSQTSSVMGKTQSLPPDGNADKIYNKQSQQQAMQQSKASYDLVNSMMPQTPTQDSSQQAISPVVMPPEKDTNDSINDLGLLAARFTLFK